MSHNERSELNEFFNWRNFNFANHDFLNYFYNKSNSFSLRQFFVVYANFTIFINIVNAILINERFGMLALFKFCERLKLTY